MTQIRKRFHLSLDAIAVWTALALATIVRFGVLKRVPW